MEIAVQEDDAVPDGIDVPTVMFSWTSQAGFPLVEVNRHYESAIGSQTVTLSQERYFSDTTNSPNNITFWIPISYATSRDPSFDDSTPNLWFPPTRNINLTIPSLTATDWLILNKQGSGYYRILYDDNNYRLLADALYSNTSLFHRLNRAQIVDDAYNFVQIGRLTYVQFMNIIRFLENENGYAGWYPAMTAISGQLTKSKNSKNTKILTSSISALNTYLSGHPEYPLFTV